MPTTKRPKPILVARAETRAALFEALRAVRIAKKKIVRAGSPAKYTIYPTQYPPSPPSIPCKTAGIGMWYPPRIPMYICRLLFPPRVPNFICMKAIKPIVVTRKDFLMALTEIELWLKYIIIVFDGAYKQPPKPGKPRLPK